jgi:hypothetical protein
VSLTARRSCCLHGCSCIISLLAVWPPCVPPRKRLWWPEERLVFSICLARLAGMSVRRSRFAVHSLPLGVQRAACGRTEEGGSMKAEQERAVNLTDAQAECLCHHRSSSNRDQPIFWIAPDEKWLNPGENFGGDHCDDSGISVFIPNIDHLTRSVE